MNSDGIQSRVERASGAQITKGEIMNEPVELKISESVLRPILEAKIQEGIVQMMGGQDKLVRDMLEVWMSQRVDSDGKISTYNSAIPRFEYLVNKMLSEALKAALDDYLKKKTDLLTREFKRFFDSKKGTSAIVEAMQDGLCKALTTSWMFKVNLTPPKD
jgi:hypothetical protein